MRKTLFAAVLALLAATASATSGPPTRPSRAMSPERREALDHLKEAQKLLRAESFDRAAEEFRAALRLDPTLVFAHCGLGQANMSLRRYPDAAAAYTGCRDTYVKLQASSMDDRMDLAGAREDQIRMLGDSIREIEAALRTMSPTSSTARTLSSRITQMENQRDALEKMRGSEVSGIESGPPASVSLALGSALFRSGRAEDAEREYKAAIAARPKYGEAHSNLAVVYLQTGRPKEALEEVKLAEKAGFRVHPDLKMEIDKALKGQ
jgi:tetratricopeptide (TPR) repeat protein